MDSMRHSLHSKTLVLLHINLAVDLCYIKSVWFDYYNPRDEVQMKSYRCSLLFTFLEMFMLSCAIKTVTKRKSGMLDWIIIMLTCNAIFATLTNVVFLVRDEFSMKITYQVNLWNGSLLPGSSESKLDLQTEFTLTVVIECLYGLGLVALKIYSALIVHRYRNELESPILLIDTLLQRNYPSAAPLPKPPGYELWYSPSSASEPDSNDPEAPPPYSIDNEKY